MKQEPDSRRAVSTDAREGISRLAAGEDVNDARHHHPHPIPPPPASYPRPTLVHDHRRLFVEPVYRDGLVYTEPADDEDLEDDDPAGT